MWMLSEIIIVGQSLEPRPFDWFAFGGAAAITFCSILFVTAFPGVQDAVERIARSYGLLVRKDFVAAALISTFFVGMVRNNTARAQQHEKPETPPVIVVKDIEVKDYSCDHTGCRMSWACGTNITVGVDKFVIQRATRQIPARMGWSEFSDYGETMTTNWATATPQHASDVRWKILIRKEAH